MQQYRRKYELSAPAQRIRETVRQHLKSGGLNYTDAAEAMGVSIATFKRVMTKGDFKLEGMIALSTWMKIPLQELIAEPAPSSQDLQQKSG